MKAILLLGGFGTRLRPFTLTTPKPLLPIVNKPFIYFQFSLLKKYNINEIILGIGYKKDQFEKAIKIGRDIGLKVFLSFEKFPLGTGGGIKNASKFLKGEEPFFVFNGDVLADFNLEKILKFHYEKKSYVTIVSTKVIDPSSYGLILTDENMKIKKFIEKPKKEEIITDKINAGVYIFNPDVLNKIPEKKEVSLEKEIFPKILNEGKEIYTYVHYGYWLDVGTIENYKKANFDLLNARINIGHDISQPQIFNKEKCFVSDDIKVNGKLVMDNNTVIDKKVLIEGNVIIGENCYIANNCYIKDSIIFENTLIHKNTEIINSIIGKNVSIGENCKLKESIIPDKTKIYDFTFMK